MKKILIIAAAILSALISGCASQPLSTFEIFHPQDLNGLVSSGQYVQKADNFFVLNDSSSSMDGRLSWRRLPGPALPYTNYPLKKKS